MSGVSIHPNANGFSPAMFRNTPLLPNRLVLCGLSVLTLLLLPVRPVPAAEARIAVAANFTVTARQLAARFHADSGHRIRLSFGSTGKLYAQIHHGAPFDAFLAADAARPQRLEAEGRALPGSRFTYAIGRLMLWSPQAGRFTDGADWLRAGQFRRLAIANPQTAPYGRAARQTLQQLGLWETLHRRLVRGDSIAQAFQFVATGNAAAGFVALAQVKAWSDPAGSLWEVPAAYHEPVEQQAVLLKQGTANPAARAFLAFLRQPAAQRIIVEAGYRLNQSATGRAGSSRSVTPPGLPAP